MKKLFSILLLSLASTTLFANCTINYLGDSTLESIIEKYQFDLEDSTIYNNLCNQLKKNRAGVFFDSMTQFSPYQITTFVSVRLYNIDDDKSILTMASNSYSSYNAEPTMSSEDSELYSLTMITLTDLAKDQKKLDKMFTQLKEMRSNKSN